ncbi:MAG TPA: hypothetical protein VLJ57_14025 [Burkholderiaceae bacterium]|nr:hypothetical protein [Burkholderiaceae bacterium]
MREVTPTMLVLNPAKIVRWLAGTAVALVAAGIFGQWVRHALGHDQVYGLVPLFDLDGERNIPALFSVCLLALAALLLTVIALVMKQRKERGVIWWAFLAVGFFLMSVDESWSFHERLVVPVRSMVGSGPGNLLHYAWVLPGALVATTVALAYLRFLMALAPEIRYAFLLAAGLYLGGAIGLEMAGGAYAARHGADNLVHALYAAVEESLEMAGTIVFIRALLAYIAKAHGDTWVRVGAGQ